MDGICLEAELEDLEDGLVYLSIEDRNRLYTPWKFSVIIKTFESKFTQQ